MTDWDYLRAAQGGDQHAWRILFSRYHALLVRVTATIAGSTDAGHDLAQDTFVRLLRCRIASDTGSFKAFVTKTAYRLALKFKQRANAASVSDLDEVVSPGLTPLDETIRSETGGAIRSVIRSLPADQRTVFALRFLAGHSYEEIAEIAGIPIGTVKSRLFYAVRTCREQLHHQGVFR